jgi:hypothetical protein
MALVAAAAKMSQIAYLPTWALSQSTAWENLSKARMVCPEKWIKRG